MRHNSNFNPEWSYLAPAPNFLRTTRLFVGDLRCGTHVDAASLAGAQRTAATNAIHARFCLPDAARGCIWREMVARRRCRRARKRGVSRCQRVRRRVNDAAPNHRCGVGRISENNDDGSAACTPSRE